MLRIPAALRVYGLSIALLCGCLLATAVVTWQFRRAIELQDRARFDNAVDRLHDAINDRLRMYVAILQGGAAFIGTEHGFSNEFASYLRRLDIQRKYPGIQGVGFTARVPAEDAAALVARRRAAGDPGFRIWPEEPRAEYHTIVHLEPLDRRNLAAIGYDMFTDPTRRDAMARARDTGLPAATGPVTLVQEIDEEKQPGFLIYMPVYEGGILPATVEERRGRLIGFVYSPFRTGDLFAGIFGRDQFPRAGFEIRDPQSPDAVLHRTNAAGDHRFSTTRRIDVAGRQWAATFFPLPSLFATSSAPLVPVAWWTGVAFSIVVAGLVAAQTRARVRLERSEATLREAQAELRDFVDSAAEGLHWVAADGTIIWANRAELDMLGYAADEYIGRNISTFHADPAAIRDILERLHAGQTLREYEAVLRCKDGSTRTVLINSNVFRRDGVFGYTRCFTRDITDRKRAETALQRALESERGARGEAEAALRLKDEFLAALSHELRTPLNAILGRTQMLMDGAVAAGKQAEVLAIVRRNADALCQIVDDMLDVSAFITGRVQMTCEPVDVDRPIRAALEIIEPAATAKRIAVSAEPTGVTVLGDRARLQQVFWNLLTNAVKFTPSGGTISVRAERRDGHVRIAVKDSGAGIEREFLPFVFDRFAQAKSSRFQGGLGLGLAIVRQIVEAHGGRVLAFSDGPGRGAEFVVELACLEGAPRDMPDAVRTLASHPDVSAS